MLTQARDTKNILKSNSSVLQKRPELYNTNHDIDEKGI
jgi:hypothetical protein